VSTPSIYKDGTITVTNGATAFTGDGTAWSTQLKRGTEINIGGLTATVAEVDGDAAGSFEAPWPGDSAAGADYVAKTWNDGADIAAAIHTLIERMIGKGLGNVASGSPLAANYRDNDIVFDRATGVLLIKDMGVLRAASSAGGYDAFGLAADRGTYDDGQGDLDAAVGRFLTYFATDEGGFYVLLAPAEDETPAVWSDLVVIKGVAAADVLAELGVNNITVSAEDPSGGADNDIWFKV
jgi:hypothetical protein